MQIPLLPEHQAAIDAARRRSALTNTKRGYEGAWRRFAAWCAASGYPSLPTASNVLAAYLDSLRREGKALATIRLYRAAIVDRHMTAGLPHPADSDDVRVVMSDLEIILGSDQKQARPLDEEAFMAIRRSAAIPRPRPGGGREKLDDALERGAKDIAIISVMRNAMLRVGEAGALVWGDIRPQANGKGGAYIRRSKTDQRSVGTLRHLGRRAMSDLELIRPAFHHAGDSVFGLTSRQITNRIKASAKTAGLGPGYSGHSPRVGMAIDLARRGVGLPALQHEGRWSSPQMIRRYLRGLTEDRGAVASYEEWREEQAENGSQRPFPGETNFSNFLFNDFR